MFNVPPVSVVLALGIVSLLILWITRCKHDWEPLVERELPSKAEELNKNGDDLNDWLDTKLLAKIASKTFFAIIGCKKCGATKQFTERT